MMKRWICWLVAFALLVPCALADGMDKTGAMRFEGAGYDTPEDAVLACIDAMNRGSVQDMLATFAVESYVDHADPEAMLERMRSFQYTMYASVPAGSESLRALLICRRASEITEGFYRQYLYYTLDDPFMPTRLDTPEERAQFLARLSDSPAADLTGRVAFSQWLSPLAIERFANSANVVNIARQADACGVDDVACMIARITIDGKDAVQFMDCACYDGRWYNLRAMGNPAILLGLSTDSNGLCAPSLMQGAQTDFEDTDLSAMFSLAPNAEALLVQTANQMSGLCGRRLALVEVNADVPEGISVAASADEALADRDGMSLFAELHFMTYGACLTLWASPSLQEARGMEAARQREYFAWLSGLGAFTLSSDDFTLKRSGDRLILTSTTGEAFAFAM